MLRKPPDILITTPESLYLLLTSQAREMLRTVETVIVDEMHAVAGTSAARTRASLERLDRLVTRPASGSVFRRRKGRWRRSGASSPARGRSSSSTPAARRSSTWRSSSRSRT